MTCDRCYESARNGCRFCPYCGEILGSDPGPSRRDAGTSGMDVLIKLIAPLILLVLTVEFAYLWAGSVMTFDWLSDKSVGILLLVPMLVSPFRLSGLALQLLWVFIVLAITASAIILVKELIQTVGEERSGNTTAFRNSSIYWLVMLFCADMLISIVLALTSSSGDIPEFETGFVPQAIFEFADAAVWEEVITRIGYIGIPMAVAALVCRKEKAWKYLLGGFGFSKLAVVLLIISSLVFGFAHLPGWGIWKVLPTALGGVLMGYLYIRFGVHVCIIYHFILDFTSVMMDGLGLYLLGVFMLGTIIIGLFCIPMMLSRFWGYRDSLKELPKIFSDDHSSSFFKR